nr:hypothetical protein BaRGS_007277 [Batillaria attramentaria]
MWAAQREEEKIAVMQKQKEQRLRQFQQDVKKRVRHMNKVKRKQQLEKDFELVHTFTSQARQKLSSRRLEDVPDCDSDSDMLPGGRWEKADQSPPWARPAWSELQINDISEDKEELEKFRHGR